MARANENGQRGNGAGESDRLLGLLAGYDDAIVEGIAPVSNPDATSDISADEADRLRRAEAVVELLVQTAASSAIGRDCDPSAPGLGAAVNDAASHAAGENATVTHIGRFQIVRELGRGGLGVVFLAYDPVLKRNVALKLPRPEALLTPELRRRFLREAQAVARLTHPNLVPAFEAGEVGPLVYLASNYAEGPTLAAWLAQQTEPPAQKHAARWVSVLADAIHYAHSQGVLHRDITPGNVILVRDDSSCQTASNGPAAENLTPKLVDFGLAKVEGTTSIETRAGMAMGTLGYMAPEQAEGRLDDFGPPTDVYALGAVLYHLLTGNAPYAGPSTAATLQRMFASDLTPPRQANRHLSRDLEAISLKCLEQQPARRYPSAGELAADLRRFLAHEATVARPLGRSGRLIRWIRRRPMTAALVAVSCLAAAIIVAGSTLYSWRLAEALGVSENRRLEAVAMRTEADGQRQRATAQRDNNEQLLYASNMRLADQLINHGDIAQATRLFDRYADGTSVSHLRGFEWHYLKRLLRGERLTLRGHRGEVYGVAFTRDGKFVVSGGEDGLIKLWDAATGDEVRSIEAHSSCTNQIAFSPDGRWLASASCDKTVKLWNAETWSVDQTLADHTSEVLALAFSPDGNHLASGGKDGLICVWSLPEGRLVEKLHPAHATVDAVAFSPDGKLLAAGLGTKYFVLWDAATWEKRLELPAGCVALEFAPDGKRIALATGDVDLRDIESGKIEATLRGHVGEVQAVTFSPDGRLLATAGGNGTLIVWNLATLSDCAAVFDITPAPRAGTRILLGHSLRAQAAAFSPDSASLATASLDGTVRLWDLAAEKRNLPVLECPVGHAPLHPVIAAITHDLTRLTISGANNEFDVWDVLTRRRIAQYDIPSLARDGGQVISPDGQYLAISTLSDGCLSVRAIADAESMRQLAKRDWYWRTISFSPTGQTIAAMDHDGKLGVWDVASGQRRFAADLMAPDAEPPARRLFPVILRNDDQLLVLRGKDREIIDLPSRRRFKSQGDEIGELGGICVSPIAPVVAILQHTPHARLMNCATGATLHTLHLSEAAMTGAFSADGRTLATATGAGQFTLWHVATGQEMVSFRTRPGSILALRFSDDGRSLGAVVQHAESQVASLYIWSAEPSGGRK